MNFVAELYKPKKLPDQSLAVIQCGHQKCNGGYTSPLKLYPDYSVTFILEGKGRYTIDGISYDLSAGQGFLIVPEKPVTYTADVKEPWKYIYAIFRGMDSKALIHNCGLSLKNPIFSFEQDEAFRSILYAMHSASRENRAMGYDVIGYFILAMSRLVEAASSRNRIADQPEVHLENALAYIENHYPYPITINDIARFINIDRSYLYRLFIQHTQMSPTHFLTKYRLAKATQMMEHPNLSLSEIAFSTGFCSQSHFNRAFVTEYGISPGKYRKMTAKKEHRGGEK